MYEFTPAPNPLAALWSPGSFRYDLPIPRDAVLERIRKHTRGFDDVRILGRRRGGMVSWVQTDRVRMWHASRLRGQPSRGALLFDARLADSPTGTTLTGRLRLGVGYIATAAWTAVYVVVGSVVRLPAVLLGLLVLIALIQGVGTALYGARDAQPLLKFADELLNPPAQEETEVPAG